MNKRLCYLAIFFLALSAAGGIFESILLKLQGYSLVFEQSHAHWFLIISIVRLVGHLFVLRFLYYKAWRFLSVLGTIAVILYSMEFVMQYYTMLNVARELHGINTIILMANIFCGIALGAGFLFSDARKEKIFQVLGVSMIIFGILLATSVFAMSSPRFGSLAMQSLIWLTLFSNMFPILYLLVFVRAVKDSVETATASAGQEIIELSLFPLGMIGLIAMLMVGGELAKESYRNRQWQKNGPAEVEKLAQRFESRTYVNRKGDSLRYLLLIPLDYDSAQKYPLVICLHGGPTQIAGRLEVTEPAPLLSEHENRKRYPSFVFVPQAGPGILWGGIAHIPIKEEIVFEAMEALERQYSIDAERRYVTGISGGGYGTWHFICSHPETFAAAMPICGAGDPSLASRITDIPVWAFHGDVDRNVPVSGSRNMVEAIRKAGGNPKYNEFAGVGHNVWPNVRETAGLLDWLFAQKRESKTPASK